MIDHALKMYDYHVWANKKMIDRLKELPEDIYNKEIQSIFPSISKALSHIYLADHLWLDVISGKSMNEAFAFTNQLTEQMESKRIEEMETMFFDLSERYKAFLNVQEDMEKVIVVDNPYAGLLETSISESVLHVVSHGSYHRGNIAAMLRQQGHASIMQDYGLYLYEK
ncbi:DinB family protein [Ectobacillus panaciterrae]|uniref:DinB family protein n=1 Tax=Ectobacillus panaciterrae TaxID=363872 RepID=UPI0004288C77|nr:DinB family protein [Ectobacillus panaciterrae]